MNSLILFLATNPAPQQQMPPGGCLIQSIPLVLIFVLFWFLIIRPQKKQQQEHQKMLDSLQVGEHVLTNSGIYGEIKEVHPQFFMLEIAPKVKILVSRQAIAARLPGHPLSLQQGRSSGGKKDNK